MIGAEIRGLCLLGFLYTILMIVVSYFDCPHWLEFTGSVVFLIFHIGFCLFTLSGILFAERS